MLISGFHIHNQVHTALHVQADTQDSWGKIIDL